MEATRFQQRTAPAIAAFLVGIAISWLLRTPFGLLAPAAALIWLTNARVGLALHAAAGAGLAGSLLVAALYAGAIREAAALWAAFFALTMCIGALVSARGSDSRDHAPAAIQGAAPSYPAQGPSLEQKTAPRNSPVVGITAADDKTTAIQLVAVSFWGGLPFHLRYWRREPDGRYRWVESRSESLPDAGGARQWRAITVEIDDQSSEAPPPTKLAANPTSDDEAVRAAKFVERLLGNAWAFDAAGRPTYLSPLAQTLVAATLEDFQSVVDEGHTFFQRTSDPDDYGRLSAAWRQSLQTGEPFFLDRRIRRASGIREWNRTGFVPTRDKQGRVTGWYGSTIDLDSHRITQAELRDRERELSQLVDLVPSHIWRLTPDGEPVFFNKRMVDFLGFDIADAATRGVSGLDALVEAIHPEDATKFRDTLSGCLITGDAFAMRYRLRRADGAFRWMSSRGEPVRDDAGLILQWYGICHDIDDQVRLDGELRERDARIRRLVDSDIIGIVIWDINGALIDANDAFLRMVQYSREDLKAGLDWLAMTPPEWRDVHAREEADELARTGKMQAREKEYFRKDGSRVPVLIGGAAFEGNARQGVAFILDLTERKRAEAALRERERELSLLVEMVPVNIGRMAPDGEPTFFSKRTLASIGIPDTGALDRAGMTRLAAMLAATVHPEDAPRMQEVMRRSLACGDPYVIRYRRRRADGIYRWMEGRANPLRDEGGAIVQWYAATMDIDDQVRAEEALRESERALWQLVETLPIMIDCAAPDGEPRYRSRQLRDFLGYELEALDGLGKSRLAGTLDAGVHPDDVAGVKQNYAHSLATGEPYARRHRLRRFDGEYLWVDTRAAPMRDAEGAIVQWNVTCLDIDAEVRAQEELRLAQERLARASQAASLAELSASIAHEVNQPLAAVVANSHACQRWLTTDPPNLERAQTTIERIIRDANGAAEVVSRIRALFKQNVRVRAGSSLTAIIEDAARSVSGLAAQHRVLIETRVEPDVPAVAIDQVQIQQVLINLMRNAVEAMAATSGPRSMGVRASKDGETVRIEVRDTGPGPADGGKIFDAFFTTKESGMGMGLAVSRSIVESHGGRLWAERNGDGGASFTFVLPIEALVPA